MDTADRARKHAEAEVADVREAMASVGTANSILATDKRRIEGDLRGMQQELDNFVSQIKNSEEKTKRAMADAGTYLYRVRNMKIKPLKTHASEIPGFFCPLDFT